jgi:transcription initiation factor TFIID subunit 2
MRSLVCTNGVSSPNISLANFMDVLTICRVLYTPVDGYILKLRLPQYWRAEHLGGGRVKFSQTGRYRIRPITTFDSRFKRAPVAKGTKRATPADEPEANGEVAGSDAKRQRLSADAAAGEKPTPIGVIKLRATVPAAAPAASPPPTQAPPSPAALQTTQPTLPLPAVQPPALSAPPSTAASTPKSKSRPPATLIVTLKLPPSTLRRFPAGPVLGPGPNSPTIFSFPSSDTESLTAAGRGAPKAKSKPAPSLSAIAGAAAPPKIKLGHGKAAALSREASSKSASGLPAPQVPPPAMPPLEKKMSFKIKLNLGKKS